MARFGAISFVTFVLASLVTGVRLALLARRFFPRAAYVRAVRRSAAEALANG